MKKMFLVSLFVTALTLICANNSMALVFSDDFEGPTINSFWDTLVNQNGNVALSSNQAHTGSQSLDLFSTSAGGFGNTNVNLIHHFDELMQGEYSVWFFDPGHAGMYSHIVADGAPGNISPYVNAIGVQDWDNAFYHANSSETISNTEGQTTFPRSPGWHQYKGQVDTNGTKLFIDDTLVYSDGVENGFKDILFELNTHMITHVYYDDFYINAHPVVPEPASILLMGMGLVGMAGRRKFAKS